MAEIDASAYSPAVRTIRRATTVAPDDGRPGGRQCTVVGQAWPGMEATEIADADE